MRLFVRLLGYLRPFAGWMVTAVVLLTLAGGLMSVMVATLKPLVNDVLSVPSPSSAGNEADAAGPDLLRQVREWLPVAEWSAWLRQRSFAQVPLLIVLVFLLRGVCLYYGRYLITKSGASVIRNLRAALYEAVVYQSLSFFRTHPVGGIHSRVLADVQRLQRVSTEVLSDLVRVAVMVPFLLVVVLVHDWHISLFALVVLPLMIYPMLHFGRRLRKASRRSQETLAEAANLLNETVTGIQVVKGFAMEERDAEAMPTYSIFIRRPITSTRPGM